MQINIVHMDSNICDEIEDRNKIIDIDYDPILQIMQSFGSLTTIEILTMGVIIYKKNGKNLMILITLKNVKYEDMCVKYDITDTNPCKTLIQGINAMTNNKIDITMERIKNALSVYVPLSKHMVFILEANDNETKLVKEDFGSKEHRNNTLRTIGWINRSELIKPAVVRFKLNQRIKSKTMFDKLYIIESNLKISCKLFKS